MMLNVVANVNEKSREIRMKKSDGQVNMVARNQKAFFQYVIYERFEAGIDLEGTEVKSIRQKLVNLSDSYCKAQDDELFILNLHIAPYPMGGCYLNHKPRRKRRLLMHRREVIRLQIKLVERGYTLIPLAIYFKRGWVKLELGLAKGKKLHDRREALKEKEAKKELRNYGR